MRKRYLRFAAIFCVLAYLGAVGTAAFRIATRASELQSISSAEFSNLVEQANAAASLGFLDDNFREAVRRSFEKTPSLAALIITGPSGAEYAVEREGGFLDTATDTPRFASRIDIAADPLTATLRVDNVRNATISAARYQAVPQELVGILRDALFMALVPLLLLILIALFGSSENRVIQAEGAANGTAREENFDGEPEMPSSSFNEEFEIPDIEMEAASEPTSPAAEPASSADDCAGEAPSGLYGPDGVLGWEAYTQERLEAELRRAAAFEQDLVLLTVDIDIEGPQEADSFKAFAEDLVSYFSFRDLSFKRGRHGAAIVLPNMDLDQGLRLTEEFMARRRGKGSNIEIGLSARAGRLVDADRLLMEADGALAKARLNGKFQIMAFRPDPERYRSFVSANS